MLEEEKEKGKKEVMEVNKGRYIESFIIGNGGEITISAEGKQLKKYN